MEIAPKPKNEEKRLAALYDYGIIDMPYEEVFENITKLVATVCEAPISHISLVDKDQLWVKAAVGLDIKEASRDVSFCSHTILNSSLTEVPDASLDKRFNTNPFVLNDPHIRFYAGMPLTTPEGYNIGSLCVIDKQAKTLTDTQKNTLAVLAKVLITLFETKKSLRKDAEAKANFAKKLKDTNAILHNKIDEHKKNNKIMQISSEMSKMLQSCLTYEEAYAIVREYCHLLFPTLQGALYLNAHSKDYYEYVTSWGDTTSIKEIFSLDDCWALRRGQPYLRHASDENLICNHFAKKEACKFSICLPLMAQSEILGLLCLESDEQLEEWTKNSSAETHRLYAIRAAEQIALSFSNIKLRQTLRNQSTRDPLTNLFNRRYLQEIFKRELIVSMQKKSEIGVVMVDIDFFKKFNDQFGHDAGDLVLKNIANVLRNNALENDLAFRLGGEEFLLLMRDTNLEEVKRRAEKARSEIENLVLEYGGKPLGKLTISLGISIYPHHGATLEDLINAADSALYQAKEIGRNRIVTYQK